MKKFLVFLSAMLLVFGVVGSAGAVPITFTDVTNFYSDHTDPNVDLVSYGGDYVNELEYFGDWVRWTHHFDFDPKAAKVLSGKLTLTLEDDGGSLDSWEIAFGWAEDGTWDIAEVDTGSYQYDVTASYLEDGEFTITLASAGGDFYINKSELEISYEPVPEPATMLLFGVGLCGLALVGRKRLAKS